MKQHNVYINGVGSISIQEEGALARRIGAKRTIYVVLILHTHNISLLLC